jgi:hypothetical protein
MMQSLAIESEIGFFCPVVVDIGHGVTVCKENLYNYILARG